MLCHLLIYIYSNSQQYNKVKQYCNGYRYLRVTLFLATTCCTHVRSCKHLKVKLKSAWSLKSTINMWKLSCCVMLPYKTVCVFFFVSGFFTFIFLWSRCHEGHISRKLFVACILLLSNIDLLLIISIFCVFLVCMFFEDV